MSESLPRDCLVLFERNLLPAWAYDAAERERLEAQRRHEQKMDALGRLASGIAHDFNNVIAAILGYSGLLLEDSRDEQTRRGRLEQIHKAAERARSLTTQVLAFSRKTSVEPAVLDLNAVVEDAARMLERLVGEHIATVVRLAAGTARVRANAGELVQVLTNLVVNARDAMPDGGTLTIETASAELDDGCGRMHRGVLPGAYVVLTVSDSGIGMPPDVRDRLFEPFFTTKEVGKGTGLGLATVHAIVTQRGGHVSVDSDPGRGTTFRIHLPAVTADASFDDAAPARRRPIGTDTATILVVEDDEDVRALVGDALAGHGYAVLSAATPDQALRLADERPIHLLVTDVVMPGRTGPSLATALMARRPDVRVLYMSGFTDEVVIHGGARRSDATFLQKPFTLAELQDTVHKLLDARA